MKPKINPFWGFVTLGLLLLTFVLCVVGAKHGVLVLKTDARPEDTVETFFESVVIGKYEEANACLEIIFCIALRFRTCKHVDKRSA